MRTQGSHGLGWWPLAYFLLAQVPFLLQPVSRTHKWRQADTAAVTRNLAWESGDIRLPRIDARGDLTGVTGMEFPLFQAAAAIPMRILGSDADAIGKGAALASLVVGWLALVALMVRRFGLDPLAAHASLAVSPFLFLYGSRFMPESFAWMCGMVALERFDAWLSHRGAWRLVLACAAMSAAMLVRPFVAFLGLPLAVGAVVLARRRPWSAAAVAAGGALALLPFALWYFWWVPQLARDFGPLPSGVPGRDYLFMGSPIRENLAAMASPGFWAVLAKVICQEYVSWQLLPLALLGGVALWQTGRGRPDRWLWLTVTIGIPAITLPVLLLLTGRHFSPHDYYLAALMPPVALGNAAGFDVLRRRWPRSAPWVVALAVIALPLTLFHHYRPDPDLDRYRNVVPLVAASVPSGDLVLVEDLGGFAWHLHPLRRRGWIERRPRLEDAVHVADLARRGCRWVVWLDGSEYRLSAVEEWLQRVRARPAAPPFDPP